MKIITTTFLFVLSIQLLVGQSFLDHPFQYHYLNNTTRYSTISFMGNNYYDGIGREFLLNELPSSVVTGYVNQFVPKGELNPLFGNVAMSTKAADYPIELMIQGSQQGEGQVQFASRLYRRRKGTWTMHNLVDGYRYQNDLDKNDDGFQDLMNKNRLVAIHSNSYQRGRYSTNLLAHYVQSDATSGELDFDKDRDYLSDSLFGLGNDVQSLGLTWNNNINLTKPGGKTYRRLSVNTSSMRHAQTNFYGQNQLDGQEQFFNTSITYFQRKSLNDFSIGAMYRYQDISVSEFGLYNDLALYNYGSKVNRASLFGTFNSFFGAATQFKSGVRVDYENEQIGVYPRLQLDFAIYKGGDSGEDLGYLSIFTAREKRLDLAYWENQEFLNSGRSYDLRGFFNNTSSPYDIGWSTGASFTLNDFELDMYWSGYELYFYNTKIVWRSILFEDLTNVILRETDATEGGLVSFEESQEFSAQHWLELASNLRFQRFYTHFNFRINNIGNQENWLVPNTSLALTSSYNFQFGLSTSLRFMFQGRQNLNNGTTSPCIYRLDWKNSFVLDQYWRNYFTENATFFFGINNLFNQRQQYLVRNAETPFSNLYDGSQTWGNTVGFQIYGGMKFNLRW